jgi:hypothetical protein
MVQSLLGLAVIVTYAVAGWDPLVRLFFWLVIPSPRWSVFNV